MSETRSRMSSGPSRFMGGALIVANRTAPSRRTISFSKTNEPAGVSLLIAVDIYCSPIGTDYRGLDLLVTPRLLRSFGKDHGSTDQTFVLEIVVCLLNCAERITIHEGLDPAQRRQVNYLLQRDGTAVQTRH